MILVPILSNDATAVLTGENLQAVGITTGLYYLDALLIKPGLKVLSSLSSISELIKEVPNIILDASRIKFNQEGIAKILSPYDGSTIKVQRQEIEALVRQLGGSVVRDDMIITDLPIQDAIAGKVYSVEGIIAITDVAYKHQHLALSEGCVCPTCELNLTRAYFHHLYQETPLLSQRYLAMHNLSQYSFNR